MKVRFMNSCRLLIRKHHLVRGYTLIEVLVVAAIVGLLAGVGVASYNRFNQKQKVQQAALDFATHLRVTQKRANAGEKSACGNEKIVNYQVMPVEHNYAFSTYINCTSMGAQVLASDTYSDFIHFEKAPPPPLPSGPAFTFTFMPLNQGLQAIAGVVIQDAQGKYKFRVDADVGGVITVTQI